MTTHVQLALVPRDGFFCKDGRDWFTSASGRGHGLAWPWPSTVLGAMRTAWGKRREGDLGRPLTSSEWRRETAAVELGRYLMLRRTPVGAAWTQDHRVWPVPADALWLDGEGQVRPLDPAPLGGPLVPTLGKDEDPLRESLWTADVGQTKASPSPRWWKECSFVDWLARLPVPASSTGVRLEPIRRLQAHVGIRPETLTAEGEILFQHDVVETLEWAAEWALGVEVTLPDDRVPSVARLGSDGRLVAVEELPLHMTEPPGPLLASFRSQPTGLRLVTVTPTFFDRGWIPDEIEAGGDELRGRLPGQDITVVLRAAMLPRPTAVSGWDMAAQQPKPVSRMVAPGAVYFFERADREPFGEAEARALWLAALGGRTKEGYGRVVPGIWNPRRR